MVYFPRTGVCLANKTGVDWYEGEHFCKTIYPSAHLIDITTEAEQASYVELCGKYYNIVYIQIQSFIKTTLCRHDETPLTEIRSVFMLVVS